MAFAQRLSEEAISQRFSLDQARILIDHVVGYCWDDEREDYRQHPADPTHIFVSLVAIDNWLNGTDYRPEYYLTVSRAGE